jgi:hypothetical protein
MEDRRLLRSRRALTGAVRSPVRPATLWMRAVSTASARVIPGRIIVRWQASLDAPAPGAPSMRAFGSERLHSLRVRLDVHEDLRPCGRWSGAAHMIRQHPGSAEHLIHLQQQRRGKSKIACLGGLEVDDQFELDGPLHGQISGLCASEHLVHVYGQTPLPLPKAHPIGHQAPSVHIHSPAVWASSWCSSSSAWRSASSFPAVCYDSRAGCSASSRGSGGPGPPAAP